MNNTNLTPYASPFIQPPQMFGELTTALINNQTKKAGQDNTALAYDSKVIEFKQCCHSVFSSQGALAEIVTEDKAFGFILYNSYREKIKSKGRKKRGDDNIVRFSRENYNAVCTTFITISSNSTHKNNLYKQQYIVITSIYCVYKMYLQMLFVLTICQTHSIINYMI